MYIMYHFNNLVKYFFWYIMNSETEMNTLGSRIYKIRTDLGLSQKQFADTLGIGRMSFIRYETDQNYPNAKFLTDLHKLCGVSMDWLLLGTEKSAFDDLNNDEQTVLAIYKTLNEEARESLFNLILSMRHLTTVKCPCCDDEFHLFKDMSEEEIREFVKK